MMDRFWELMRNHAFWILLFFVLVGVALMGFSIYRSATSPETQGSLEEPITNMTRGELYWCLFMVVVLTAAFSGGGKKS